MDGVVTDDNDVFLFGGTHVYRHIFDNKKWVLVPWVCCKGCFALMFGPNVLVQVC